MSSTLPGLAATNPVPGGTAEYAADVSTIGNQGARRALLTRQSIRLYPDGLHDSVIRAARIALVLAVFLLVAAPSAMAADVRVDFARGNGGATVTLASLESKFDVDQTYEIRSTSGSTQSEQVRGISISALLAAVNAELGYGGVEIDRPDGGKVFISKAQIDAGAPAPVVYESAGQVRFLRPTYGAGDANAADLISTTGTLLIRQTERPRIEIDAKAAKSKAKVGETVKFKATVTGAGAGETTTVTWLFGDGTKATGLAVSHRFKKRGSYKVIATVTTSGEPPVSNSDIAPVQIGKTVKSKKNRTGGGNNDASGAPDSGASDGNSGSGDSAATDTGDTKPKPRRKKKTEPTPQVATLPQVTGQLLDPTVVTPQQQQQSDLAARSGQPVQEANAGGGIPSEALGGAGALGLLALGFMLELGTFRARP